MRRELFSLTKTDTLDTRLIRDFHNGKREESVKRLFNKYLPLILYVWKRYPFSDMEINDWKQECVIVLVHNLNKYQENSNNSFRALFKNSIYNLYKDILRRRNAMKRVPEDKIMGATSKEELDSIDYLKDSRNADPLRNLDTKIIFERLTQNLTSLELEVLKCNLLDLKNDNCESVLKLRDYLNSKYKDGDRKFMKVQRDIKRKLRDVINILEKEWS